MYTLTHTLKVLTSLIHHYVLLCNTEYVLFKQCSGNDSSLICDSVLIHAFVSFTFLVISFTTPVSLTCKLKEHLNYAHRRTSQHAVHLN